MRAKQSLLVFLTVVLVIPAALQLAGRIAAAFDLTGPIIELAIAWRALVGEVGRTAIEFCFGWIDWLPSDIHVEAIALSVLLVTASGMPVLRAWFLRRRKASSEDEPSWIGAAFVLGTVAVIVLYVAPSLAVSGEILGRSQNALIFDPRLLLGVFGFLCLFALVYTLLHLNSVRREEPNWVVIALSAAVQSLAMTVLFICASVWGVTEYDAQSVISASFGVSFAVTIAIVVSAFLDVLAMARVFLGVLATLLGNQAYEFLARLIQGG